MQAALSPWGGNQGNNVRPRAIRGRKTLPKFLIYLDHVLVPVRTERRYPFLRTTLRLSSHKKGEKSTSNACGGLYDNTS